MKIRISAVMVAVLIAFGFTQSFAVGEELQWVTGKVLALDEVNMKMQVDEHWYHFQTPEAMQRALNFEGSHQVAVLDMVRVKFADTGSGRFVVGIDYQPPKTLK